MGAIASGGSVASELVVRLPCNHARMAPEMLRNNLGDLEGMQTVARMILAGILALTELFDLSVALDLVDVRKLPVQPGRIRRRRCAEDG